MPWLCLRKSSSKKKVTLAHVEENLQLTGAKGDGEHIRVTSVPRQIGAGEFLRHVVLEEPQRQETSLLFAIFIRCVLPVLEI